MLVFPAYAGMSRTVTEELLTENGFPRLRGDEPSSSSASVSCLYVFPAYAGMSRQRSAEGTGRRRFPRLRGDEPPT